jgi:hypothetical protein
MEFSDRVTIEPRKRSGKPLRQLRGLLLAVASILGCRGSDASASVAQVWTTGQEWRLSSEPLFTIGAVDGVEAIGRVAPTIAPGDVNGVALLSGGRIAVMDAMANHIRIYDDLGNRLTIAGRNGDGPGEFRGLQGIYEFADGDSLLAWDSGKRLSIFSADGSFSRTVPTQTLGSSGFMLVAGVARNGTSLIQGSPSSIGWKRPTSGEFRPPYPYRLISPGGDSVASFGPLLGGEGIGAPDVRDVRVITFGRKSEIALGKQFIYSGENDSFRVAVSRPGASEPDRYLRRPYDPIPVPNEILSAGQRADRENRTYPVFTQIFEDPDENVWILHGAPHTDTLQTWSVFDPEGAWLGEVRFPATMSVRAIGRDVIAVVVKDDLSVEYVKVFRIVKPG